MNESNPLLLRENPVQYLASRWPGQRRPNHRPAYVRRGTGRQTVVLHQQPKMSTGILWKTPMWKYRWSPAYAWIQLSGKAVFRRQPGGQRRCMGNPIVRKPVPDRRQLNFLVFYLEEARRTR